MLGFEKITVILEYVVEVKNYITSLKDFNLFDRIANIDQSLKRQDMQVGKFQKDLQEYEISLTNKLESIIAELHTSTKEAVSPLTLQVENYYESLENNFDKRFIDLSNTISLNENNIKILVKKIDCLTEKIGSMEKQMKVLDASIKHLNDVGASVECNNEKLEQIKQEIDTMDSVARLILLTSVMVEAEDFLEKQENIT